METKNDLCEAQTFAKTSPMVRHINLSSFTLNSPTFLFMQIFTAALTILPGLSYGMLLSFSAPALVIYQNSTQNNPLDVPLNDSQGSWFGEYTFPL